MGNPHIYIVLAIVFLVVVVIAVLKYDQLKASWKGYGAEFGLTGDTSPKVTPRIGISRNWTFGRGKFKTKGHTSIEDNKTFGTGEFEAEDSELSSNAQTPKKPTK